MYLPSSSTSSLAVLKAPMPGTVDVGASVSVGSGRSSSTTMLTSASSGSWAISVRFSTISCGTDAVSPTA